jgi:hypothetical protein
MDWTVLFAPVMAEEELKYSRHCCFHKVICSTSRLFCDESQPTPQPESLGAALVLQKIPSERARNGHQEQGALGYLKNTSC